jgi:hypothetical protein
MVIYADPQSNVIKAAFIEEMATVRAATQALAAEGINAL